MVEDNAIAPKLLLPESSLAVSEYRCATGSAPLHHSVGMHYGYSIDFFNLSARFGYPMLFQHIITSNMPADANVEFPVGWASGGLVASSFVDLVGSLETMNYLVSQRHPASRV